MKTAYNDNSKISDQFHNLSHHAYLLIGDSSTRDQLISIFEKTYKVTAHGNPDFYIRNYEIFTIDDSREIKILHNSKPTTDLDKKDFGAGKKFFVLTMNGITIEAQNSLLKLLEEPADYAHFFLIIPSAHLLLPTVKSRLSIIDNFSVDKFGSNLKEIDSELLDQAKTFLNANVTKRLDIVKKLVEEISKEKKTKQDAIDFVTTVEVVIYENIKMTSKSKDDLKGSLMKNKKRLEAISLVRNYIHDRAPSVKMLLEYMALNI